MKKALSVGSRSPIVASFGSKKYQQATLVTLLAALEVTYVVRNEENTRLVFVNLILALTSSRGSTGTPE